MKRKRRQLIAVVVGAVAVASLASWYSIYLEQTRIKGFTFGNELLQIQEELDEIQREFETHRVESEEGRISEEDLVERTREYVSNLEGILPRYDALDPPPTFISSVDLFNLSAKSQAESARELLLWLETGDASHKIRSDELFQESFEYELTALASYNEARGASSP